MTSTRAGYIAGLHALADVLEANPEVPLPYSGSEPEYARLSIHHLGAGQREAFLATVRAFPGTKAKEVRDAYYDVEVSLHGLHLTITADRATVCERVVTGTRDVTRTVEVPVTTRTEKVTETVEDVEWVCTPLLQPVPVSA